MSSGLFERYRNGDRDRVWAELRKLGARVREEEHLAEANAVAREAMERARKNVDLLVARLRSDDYVFERSADNEAVIPWAHPNGETPAAVERLEAAIGMLPLTVRAWIEVVGDVSLFGVHPRWPESRVTDPLMLDFTGSRMAGEAGRSGQASHLSYLESEYAAYCADRDELPAWNCGPFVLPLSPDALHKANISGGPAYGVQIPDACADAVFRYCDGVLMPFIGYLNLAFRFGGFPGFWHGQNAEEKYSARRIGDGLLGL